MSIARWLLEGPAAAQGSQGPLDLSRVTVVMPGSRAGRLVLASLIEQSQRLGRGVLPPTVLTIGRLVSAICAPNMPVADNFVSTLSWVAALKRVDRETRGTFVTGEPAADRLADWLPAAGRLGRVQRELAAAGVGWSDVIDGAARVRSAEVERWRAAARLDEERGRALEAVGYQDEWATVRACVERNRFAVRGPVVLAGILEMPAAVRGLLRASGAEVTALVLAPEEHRGGFDAFGCVNSEYWGRAKIAPAESCIRVVEKAQDGIDLAISTVAACGPRRADEIVICAADAELIPHLIGRADGAGLRLHDGAGVSLSRTRVCALLRAISAYITTRRFRDFAALLRHPDIERWLRSTDESGIPHGRILSEFDRYESERVPAVVPDRDRGAEDGVPPVVRNVAERVRTLVGPCLGAASRRLSVWGETVFGVLTSVCAGSTSVESEAELKALEVLMERATAMSRLAGAKTLDPLCTVEEAAEMLLAALEDASSPSVDDPAAIDVVGWLELAYDDAPAAVVLGLNEGVVPGRQAASLISGALRRELGLTDDLQRAARDAYLLTLVVRSRAELTVIVPRRSMDGDPLMPSRLLFACPDGELVARVRVWTEPIPSDSISRADPFGSAERSVHGDFVATGYRVPAAMRVTWFRTYLRSPYEFYLRHVLGLREVEPRTPELSAAAFGDLIHSALHRFGMSGRRDTEDAGEIEEFLSDELAALTAERYGGVPPGAVRLQIEQARERLRAFAAAQSRRRAEGWSIHRVEWEPDTQGEGAFGLGAVRMPLLGRIDRIDRHPEMGYAILDYKTGESASEPDRSHRRSRGAAAGWIDLQLPLYRHLASGLTGGARVALGYFAIPARTDDTGVYVAEWSEDDLTSADHAAAEVVTAVRSSRFFEIGSEPIEEGTLGRLIADLRPDAVVRWEEVQS